MDIKEIKQITQENRNKNALKFLEDIEKGIKTKAETGDFNYYYSLKGESYSYKDEIMELLRKDGFQVEDIKYEGDIYTSYSLLIKWE